MKNTLDTRLAPGAGAGAAPAGTGCGGVAVVCSGEAVAGGFGGEELQTLSEVAQRHQRRQQDTQRE